MSSTLISCGICQEEFDNDVTFTDHFLQVHTSDKTDSDEEEEPTIVFEKDSNDLKNPQIASNTFVRHPILTSIGNNVSSGSVKESTDRKFSQLTSEAIVQRQILTLKNNGSLDSKDVKTSQLTSDTAQRSLLIPKNNNLRLRFFKVVPDKTFSNDASKIVVQTDNSGGAKVSCNISSGQILSLSSLINVVNKATVNKTQTQQVCLTLPTAAPVKEFKNPLYSTCSDNMCLPKITSVQGNYEPTINNSKNSAIVSNSSEKSVHGNYAPAINNSKNSAIIINSSEKSVHRNYAPTINNSKNSAIIINSSEKSVHRNYAPTINNSKNSAIIISSSEKSVHGNYVPTINNSKISAITEKSMTTLDKSRNYFPKNNSNSVPGINNSKGVSSISNQRDNAISSDSKTSNAKLSEAVGDKQTSNPSNKVLLFKFPSSKNSNAPKVYTLNSVSELQPSHSESTVKNSKYSELFQNACDVCGDMKAKPHDLAKHILCHIGAMPYFCTHCNFSCISKLRFQQHLYFHVQLKTRSEQYWLFERGNLHQCEDCEKLFPKWTDLIFHYTSHILNMPYQCHACKMYFTEMKDFQIHSHLHKSANRCQLCDIFFNMKPRLLDHVLHHNRTKFFRKFRHIHWNNGLCQVEDPYSVIRSSYYNKLVEKIDWEPKDADFDEFDRFQIMMELCKCDINYGENEDVVDTGKEDVRDLCEISLEVISDASQIEVVKSIPVTDTDVSSESDRPDKSDPGLKRSSHRKKKRVVKRRAKRRNSRASNEVEVVESNDERDLIFKESSTKNYSRLLNKVEELKSSEAESTIGQKMKITENTTPGSDVCSSRNESISECNSVTKEKGDNKAGKGNVKCINKLVEFSPHKNNSTSGYNLQTSPDISEPSNLKTLCIKLVKLPPEVVDMKSYRKYAGKQRNKLARLKWRKYAEMKKVNPNARNENRRFNFRPNKSEIEPKVAHLDNQKEVACSQDTKLENSKQHFAEKNTNDTICTKNSNARDENRRSSLRSNKSVSESNALHIDTQKEVTCGLVSKSQDCKQDFIEKDGNDSICLERNKIEENEKNRNGCSEGIKRPKEGKIIESKNHLQEEITSIAVPETSNTVDKSDVLCNHRIGMDQSFNLSEGKVSIGESIVKQAEIKSNKRTGTKGKKIVKLKRRTESVHKKVSKIIKFLESESAETKIEPERKSITNEVSGDSPDKLTETEKTSDSDDPKSNTNILEEVNQEKQVELLESNSRLSVNKEMTRKRRSENRKRKRTGSEAIDNTKSKIALTNKVFMDENLEFSDLKCGSDVEIINEASPSSERTKINCESLDNHKRKNTLINEAVQKKKVKLLESACRIDVEIERKESTMSSNEYGSKEADSVKNKMSLRNRVSQEKDVKLLESAHGVDVEIKRKLSTTSSELKNIDSKKADNAESKMPLRNKVSQEKDVELLESKINKSAETKRNAFEGEKIESEAIDNLKTKPNITNNVSQDKNIEFLESKSNKDKSFSEKETESEVIDHSKNETNLSDEVSEEKELLESIPEDVVLPKKKMPEGTENNTITRKRLKRSCCLKNSANKSIDCSEDEDDPKPAGRGNMNGKDQAIETPKNSNHKQKQCNEFNLMKEMNHTNEHDDIDIDANSELNILRHRISLDHSYHVNNRCANEKPLEDNSNSLKKTSSADCLSNIHTSKPKVFKKFIRDICRNPFEKDRNKGSFVSTISPMNKRKLIDKIHTSNLNNKIRFLKSKARTQKVTVNLVRLPDDIYIKHLKTKPIMLSNILPVIASVISISKSPEGNSESPGNQNFTDFQSVFNVEHNYCRSLRSLQDSVTYYESDSDSESTLSAYSNNVSD